MLFFYFAVGAAGGFLLYVMRILRTWEMGGATRFLVLLTTPFPLLHRHSSSLLRLSRHHKFFLYSLHYLTCSRCHTPPLLSSPLKASHQLHNQAASSVRNGYFEDYSSGPHHSHPWPEWSKFIDHISASGYLDNWPCEDELVAAGELNPFFLREASACLAFARNRENILRFVSNPLPLSCLLKFHVN